MDIQKQRLLIEQTDKKLQPFKQLNMVVIPERGWVHTIRTSLRMSLRQLAARLHKTPQSVKEMEQRESEGSISLKSLREVGAAMDMQLVYGFIPKEKSIEAMIEKRALELAKEIVQRTSNSMLLEDQENSNERLNKAIKQRAEEIKISLPNYLWD